MGYGPGTDAIGLAGTGIELQKQSFSNVGQRIECKDENGDTVAATVIGKHTTVSCEYASKSGTAITIPDLGAAAGDYYVTKVGVALSNTGAAKLTVEGILSSLFAVVPDTYAHGLTITGGKGALETGFTVTAGKPLSLSCDASVTVGEIIYASDGAIADIAGLYDCIVTNTIELQAATGDPAATAAAGYTLDAGGGSSNDVSSYGTATFVAFKHVVATVVP